MAVRHRETAGCHKKAIQRLAAARNNASASSGPTTTVPGEHNTKGSNSYYSDHQGGSESGDDDDDGNAADDDEYNDADMAAPVDAGESADSYSDSDADSATDSHRYPLLWEDTDHGTGLYASWQANPDSSGDYLEWLMGRKDDEASEPDDLDEIGAESSDGRWSDEDSDGTIVKRNRTISLTFLHYYSRSRLSVRCR